MLYATSFCFDAITVLGPSECEPFDEITLFFLFSVRSCMAYRCEATSIAGFVQIIASNYLPHGYWFYVTGCIPEGKDPMAVDQRILARYGIALSRQQRARRKQQGLANLHYVRFEQFFVILATHGHHPFFAAEASSLRDIRKHPIQFHGYSISVKRGGFVRKDDEDSEATPDGRHRVRVMIGHESFRNLSAHLMELATHRSAETLRWEFWNQPFEPYAPIRKQLLKVLRQVNARRSAMGYEKLPTDCIRYRRKIVKPFERLNEDIAA